MVTEESGRADPGGSAHRCAAVARDRRGAGLLPVVECVGAVGPRCGIGAARARPATAPAALTAGDLIDRERAAVAIRPGGQPRRRAVDLAALRGRGLPWPVGSCVGSSVLEPVAQGLAGPARSPARLPWRADLAVPVLRATGPSRAA